MKIGEIRYANVYPIFYYLKKIKEYDFVRGTPSFLNKMIREGGVDVGVCSSIEYARNPGKYVIIPDISISSVGDVKSVCLFSSRKIENLENATVFLTEESGTSVVLLKILLKYYFNVKVYFTNNFDDSDAVLLIGDKALFSYYNNDYKYVYDLGFHWFQFSGYPFVFALWIADSKWEGTEDIKRLHKNLVNIKVNSQKNLAALLEEYSFKGLTSYQILDYWDIIDYNLTEKHICGLIKFYKLAYEAGEIKKFPSLNLSV